MPAQLSHKHHYVPEWYQRRFLHSGATAFKILDLHPKKFRDKKGVVRGTSTSILNKGPAAWFFEKDLYSTRVFGTPNDDIETYLFGAIDREGRRAIDAFLAEDWNTVHETYWQMFEFLDALRIRTPKGLAFLKAITKSRNHEALLFEMQRLRKMHCLMWAEGAREILSAEDSDAKFILTDHPVTFFNRHVFPADPAIPPHLDPLQHWQGTQTLFPFDSNHLFVMTNYERARNPLPKNARKSRTNPRLFDNSMVWYHDTIRNRSLNAEQVREVNYILKTRAKQYVAGVKVDDLFPERQLKIRMWNKLGRFLLPSGYEIAAQVGYTVVGKDDGTFYFQDEFGRRPQSKAEYEVEVARAKRMEARLKKLIREHEAKRAK